MNKFIVLDFETSGLNYWEPDFQVTSCSLVWNDGTTEFIMGQDRVGGRLAELRDTPIFVYNLAFEQGVCRCVYPNITPNFSVDIARLCQLFDSGGDGPLQGFSLKKCVRRILGKDDNYADEIHSWLRANIPGVKRGKEGAYLSQAPIDILERYNIADSKYTLELYEFITKKFEKEGYDWKIDHELYFSSVALVVDAKIRGVIVERDKLANNLEIMQKEVSDLDTRFRTDFDNEIQTVRQQLLDKKNAKLKKKKHTELPEFNIGSKTQLRMLFVDLLGIDIGFKTKTGNPSFKSVHLGLYGSGGELLSKRGKKLLIVNQALALLELSKKDGRWHQSLKLANVRTGRFAGGN